MEWDLSGLTPEAPQEAGERELVPEGVHAFEIKAASEGLHKWKPGEYLSLRLSAIGGRYGFVFDDIVKGPDGASRAAQLAAALGVTGQRVSLAPADLEGREVRAEVYHKVGKNGRTFVNVSKYLPPEAAPVAAKATRPKGKAVEYPNDDIPF